MSLSTTATLLLAVTIAAPAHADPKQMIAECASKTSDAIRLVCYDDVARSLGVDKLKATQKGVGQWRITSEKSPIDDSVNVFVSVEADAEIRSGYTVVRPTLFLRCAEKKTSVFINWGVYLGLDRTQMLTRLDTDPAQTGAWSVSTDSKAVFVLGSDIAFAKGLFGHGKLLAQVTPYGESPVMAQFPITNIEEAIKPLRDACKW
jgi:type VI secretion system protein VasI